MNSPAIRCAIYTRKSTDEGLDQSFNTLDAQREACEAYVSSQRGEGWRPLPEHYDDGGYSGGTLNRPAMQRLLEHIDSGLVDIIVVYKVDRLTRSLMDFARIVERLDAKAVSFVSITQAFNTTTSMGRLTLNVLLSFAQFEREVTSERIRDKIAASKAKGIWMGGNVPLGYDLGDRRLVINAAEADQVRHIFNRYLAHRSGVEVVRELSREGIVSKRWVSRSGRTHGGVPFCCGSLYHLLQNRIYLGEVMHRGVGYKGEHEPLVGQELFASVQEVLAGNRRKRRARPTRNTGCSLAGLVYDAAGRQMTTSFSYGRAGKLYRYYVSGSLDPSRPVGSERPTRVPAAALERLVFQSLSKLVAAEVDPGRARSLLSRVELGSRTIQLVIHQSALMDAHESPENAIAWLQDRLDDERLVAEADGHLRLICDRKPSFRGGGLSQPQVTGTVAAIGLRQKLVSSHELLKQYNLSPFDPEDHQSAAAPPSQRDRHLMALGLLSPELQKRILQGAKMNIAKPELHNLPLAWCDQTPLFGR